MVKYFKRSNAAQKAKSFEQIIKDCVDDVNSFSYTNPIIAGEQLQSYLKDEGIKSKVVGQDPNENDAVYMIAINPDTKEEHKFIFKVNMSTRKPISPIRY